MLTGLAATMGSKQSSASAATRMNLRDIMVLGFVDESGSKQAMFAKEAQRRSTKQMVGHHCHMSQIRFSQMPQTLYQR